MKRLIFAAAMFLQAGGQPINVPIQNPSFEQAPSKAFNQNSCGPWIYEVPAWTVSVLVPGDSAGIFQPANPNPCNVSLPPDGKTVAYLSGSSISQNLGTAQPIGVYTLKFYVASRYYYYAAKYSAALMYGAEQQCETSGLSMGDFQQIILVCPVFRNPTPEDLTVTFTGDGTFQLLLDNVSLTFTPQP